MDGLSVDASVFELSTDSFVIDTQIGIYIKTSR